MTRSADARLMASVRISSSISFWSTDRCWFPLEDAQVGWTTNTSLPRTESMTSTITSPSLKRPTIALPNGIARCETISSANARFALPVKTIIPPSSGA